MTPNVLKFGLKPHQGLFLLDIESQSPSQN